MKLTIEQLIEQGFSETIIHRFSSRILKTDSCWIWTGCFNGQGYGVIGKGQRGKENVLAHRLSYFIHTGDNPAGKVIRHRCDVPACVNPEHLLAGTQADNVRDMCDRGRQNSKKKLTHEQVKEIRELEGQIAQHVIASKYGVSRRTIGAIFRGGRWAKGFAKHEIKKMSSKLSEFDVREIRRLFGQQSRSSIAKQYGVSRDTIDAIYDGRTWKHVKEGGEISPASH